MNIRPRLSTYVVSALGGYFLAFVIIAILIAVISNESVLPLIPLLMFSLVVALPVTIISSIVGYPIFRYSFYKFQFAIFPKLMIAGGLSCFACIVIYAIGFNFVLGAAEPSKSIFTMTGSLLAFCIAVLPCSALVYWFIEK
jgi:hypothetical protein